MGVLHGLLSLLAGVNQKVLNWSLSNWTIRNKMPLLGSFNRTYRHEVLSAYIFENLNQVKDIIEQ